MFGGAVSVPVDVIATLTQLVVLIDDNYVVPDDIKDAETKEALWETLTTIDETLRSILAVHDKENEWGQ
tara:strand:+ start:303 stop:509 length:207 start_codon:yes stop_codon:yes gene_type:complete